MQDQAMAGFGASDVLVRLRSRRGLAMVIGLLLPIALWILCESTNSEELEGFVGLLAAAEAITFFFLPSIAPNGISLLTGERRGAMRADREGITFRGRLLLARSEIRNIAVQGLTGGGQSVHVAAKNAKHDVHIELEDREKARALVEALDLDPEHHVASFSVEEDPLRSRLRWLAARAAIGGGGLALTLGVLSLARRNEMMLLAVVPVLLVYALLLPRARVYTDIVLGADGLTLHHRGRRRSIPLSAVAEVRNVKGGVTLVLNGGEELRLRFGAGDDEKAAAQHAAFATRMRQTLVRRDRSHEPSEALLGRGERDPAEWSKHLQLLARADEGYRVGALPEDTLWRIAEGTATEPTARVGALVALRSRFDDASRQKLKELAGCTAQRDLRAALEAAAEGAEAEEIIAAYERESKS